MTKTSFLVFCSSFCAEPSAAVLPEADGVCVSSSAVNCLLLDKGRAGDFLSPVFQGFFVKAHNSLGLAETVTGAPAPAAGGSPGQALPALGTGEGKGGVGEVKRNA